MAEYENHFIEGLRDGKSEQEIIGMLGAPKEMARAINAESAVNQAEESQNIEYHASPCHCDRTQCTEFYINYRSIDDCPRYPVRYRPDEHCISPDTIRLSV